MGPIRLSVSAICVLTVAKLCPLFMNFNFKSGFASVELNTIYDYIIVGGGTAGAVLASRLSEDSNVSVLLLEAGGEYSENALYHIPSAYGSLQNTEADWAYLIEPQKYASQGLINKRSFWPSGRVLGGSSVLNVMVYSRGLAKDYDSWAENGCDGWGFKDVLPYFLKSEDILIDRLKDSEFHAKGGPLGVSGSKVTPLQDFYVNAAKEIGFEQKDYNEMEGEAISKAQMTIRNGVRSSTGLEYLEKAKGRENLHVSVNSFVTKVKIENKRAVGVYAVIDDRKRMITSRKDVILSAGAISSPAILMRSGIGPKAVLTELKINTKADLPVGENLQNHIGLFFHTRINYSLSYNPDKVNTLQTFMEYFQFGTGYMSVPGVEAYLLANSQRQKSIYCQPSPDLQFMFLSTPLTHNIVGAREDIFEQYSGMGKGDNGFITIISVLNPRSKGKLTLKSRDPFVYPKIQPNFLANYKDIDILLGGVRILEKLLKTRPMERLGASDQYMRLDVCAQYWFRSDAYWRCIIRQLATGLFHYSGTCKMGSVRDPTAVVDPQLRVKGIDALRVVDASVIPNIVSGNTYAPVVMIAEKAADMIREYKADTVLDVRCKRCYKRTCKLQWLKPP